MDHYIKTGISSLEDVKQVLEMADVKSNTGLTGDVLILMRVLNSSKEDIVLNSSKAGAEQITVNPINVNIHIPNLKNQPGATPNTVDNTQPDIKRMEEVGRVVIEVLDDYRGFDFFLRVDSAGEVIPDGKNGFYYNIVIWYTYLRKEI
ncbi:hypothetical protein [Sphingobacterium suaedae]|uniref:Uncharacterized protein n=1 Tax=Sphingobacterium suaedae TaxID=1686402 RepID=A0ABW5KHT1_9SPHI